MDVDAFDSLLACVNRLLRGMSRTAIRVALSALAALAAFSGETAHAQCEMTTLRAPDIPYGGGGFGYSVAIDGDRIVVGAHLDGELVPGFAHGAAYVFDRVGAYWEFRDKLLPSVPAYDGALGRAVAVDGDLVAAGAPRGVDAAHLGEVYVFRCNQIGCVEEARLVGPPPTTQDWFGASVALQGDYLFVGAPWDAYVYIFQRFDNTYPCVANPDCQAVGLSTCEDDYCKGIAWVEVDRLRPDSAAEDEAIGVALSIQGNRLAVGSPYDDHAGMAAGSVYVLRHDEGEWVEEQKLTASIPEANDHYGRSVDLNSDCIVVGAPGDDDQGIGAGAAYVYRRDETSWGSELKLTVSEGVVAYEFGDSVAFSGNLIVACGYSAGPGANSDGACYLFEFSGPDWVETGQLMANQPAGGDLLGKSLAANDQFVVAGSWVGVHIFPSRDFEPDCNGNGLSDLNDVPGDFDGNTLTDLDDYRHWVQCLTGPRQSIFVDPTCCFFDVEFDCDVDLSDLATFQNAVGGFRRSTR